MCTKRRLLPSPRLRHRFRIRTPIINPLLRRQLVCNVVFGDTFTGIAVGDSTSSVSLAHVLGLQNLQEAVTRRTTLGPGTATGRTAKKATISSTSITIRTTRGLPDVDFHLHTYAVLKVPATYLN